MEILKHSGYEFQMIKTRRSLRSRSSGIKGMEAHTFNLGHTLCWRYIRTLEEGRFTHSSLPACLMGLSNCQILGLPSTAAAAHFWGVGLQTVSHQQIPLLYRDYPYALWLQRTLSNKTYISDIVLSIEKIRIFVTTDQRRVNSSFSSMLCCRTQNIGLCGHYLYLLMYPPNQTS